MNVGDETNLENFSIETNDEDVGIKRPELDSIFCDDLCQ